MRHNPSQSRKSGQPTSSLEGMTEGSGALPTRVNGNGYGDSRYGSIYNNLEFMANRSDVEPS